MLAEGTRREQDGERVVVGWIERHGREGTRAQLGDLEVISPRTVSYRDGTFADLDVQAVIDSRATLALVDELAHSVPDTNRGRWEDVSDLLAAGINVLTTTNVANLRSVRDYAAYITGVGSVESVPDEFVRSGDVTLIDMPADALRDRILSGKVYSTEQVGGALADYFRASNLEALSELGQAWMTGDVEDVGNGLLVQRGLVRPAQRPLVVAGVSGSKRGEPVVRRAAELARAGDADLVVVHVNVTDGLPPRRGRELERIGNLTVELGGTFREIQGTDPAIALANIARRRDAAKVVVGHHRSRLLDSTRLAVGTRLRRLFPQVAVVIVDGAFR